jgi:diguanylate cyclase
MALAKDYTAEDNAFALAERVMGAMKAHCSPACPRAFEVWYAHLNGELPGLSHDLRSIIARHGMVDAADIDTLYETHISNSRFVPQSERSSLGVLSEIDGVMTMIDSALGSSVRYDASLKALSDDLKGTADRSRIREIVELLVVSTREAVASNQLLEKRLGEGRGEIQLLREALEATRADALTDALTGLANRRHFEEMLQKSIDQTTINREPFCLVMCDIDFFKRFNDQHGHLTGDQVLRLVAKTMQQKLKTTAIPCRYGGEEFAVILPSADIVAGRICAETIRQALLTRELVIRSTGETIGRVTISLGVATYRRGDTISSLIERADSCLFQAKRQGRNRTVTETCGVSASQVA